MLTGLLEPDNGMIRCTCMCYTMTHDSTGDAYFYGINVSRNLDEIRSMLGVCPQVHVRVFMIYAIYWIFITA